MFVFESENGKDEMELWGGQTGSLCEKKSDPFPGRILLDHSVSDGRSRSSRPQGLSGGELFRTSAVAYTKYDLFETPQEYSCEVPCDFHLFSKVPWESPV